MLFNFIVLLVILLATAFFASQGLLSAVLAFVTGAFASILAMGLFEPLQGTIEGYWPGLARGVTFLTIYVVAFAALRFGADYAVSRKIKLPKMADTVGGGFVGFFAALVIVGTAVVGLEMLPVHTTILGIGGDQEYSNDGRMQGEKPGEVVPDGGMSMWPEHFTTMLWNGASGRGLGGSRAFGEVHPDLPLESYGYRNVVQYGSKSTLPQDLLKLKAAYIADPGELLKKWKADNDTVAAAESKQVMVVRIEVGKGTESPKESFDVPGFALFRITPTEVRLVTEKGQRYPIGCLEEGTTFRPMSLDTGHLIDDYVAEKVIEEWVFLVDREEKPLFLEVKELARVPFSEKVRESKPFAALASGLYPVHEYVRNKGSILVTVTGDSGPLKGVMVRLVPMSVAYAGAMQSAVTSANYNMEKAMEGDAWTAALGKPGVPTAYALKAAHDTVVRIGNENSIHWSEFVAVLMMGAIDQDGGRNHSRLPEFFKNTVVPLMDVRASATTGADGKALLPDAAPGDYCLVADAKMESGAYYVWSEGVKVEKKTQATATMNPGNARFTLSPVK